VSSEEEAKLLSMFTKTSFLIKDKRNRENAMCFALLKGAECYCKAILLLLDNNCVLPAKALMRCLCELAVKLMWCLQCPDDTDQVQDRKTVDEKVRRWQKRTLAQNIKVLKEYKQVDPENSKIDEQIKELEKKKDNMSVREMPPYAQLLEKLPIEFRREISLQVYSDFHKAIHLDSNSLVGLYLRNNESAVNNRDISKLKEFCFKLAEIITGVIAINYHEEGS